MTNPGAGYAVFALAVLAIRAKAGSLSDNRGRVAVVIPGLLIEGFAFFVLGLTSDWFSLLLGSALYGIAFGSVQPALLALTVDRVLPEERGKAMATFYTAWEFGIAIGSSGAGLLLEMTGFSVMLLATAIFPFIGTALSLKARTVAASTAS